MEVPLRPSQIQAAAQLQNRMPGWCVSERALDRLAHAVPGLSREEILLKAVAVNALYYTNVWAITRMAEHVTKVMQEPPQAPVELVEAIAALPPASDSERPRNYLSFASKFAHFFVDPELCPIFDSFACKSLQYHLGRGGLARDDEHAYRAFEHNFRKLRQSAGLTCSTRDLDRYLWLSGNYRELQRKPNTAISVELQELFECCAPEVRTELRQMLGDDGLGAS